MGKSLCRKLILSRHIGKGLCRCAKSWCDLDLTFNIHDCHSDLGL